MKKKLMASILAISLLATTMAFSVSAATLSPDKQTGNSPFEMMTSTIKQPLYVVTIPEKIEFGYLIKSKEDNAISQVFAVTASGVSNLFANQKKLLVTVSSKNAFILKDIGEKSSIPYEIYCNNANIPIANNGAILEANGTSDNDTNLTVTMGAQAKLNTKNILKAGHYTDVLTFNVALQEVNL